MLKHVKVNLELPRKLHIRYIEKVMIQTEIHRCPTYNPTANNLCSS
jgi:hypothetical protein